MSDKSSIPLASALISASTGDDQAAAALFPLVYDQLRRVAGKYFRSPAAGPTLQPTALVHEAFLRLAQKEPACWKDRAHFLAIAATAMRQILTDHARRRGAQKRGSAARPVTLDETVLADGSDESRPIDVLALDAALRSLEALSPRQARITELQYFGGLTVEEVAAALSVSKSLVEKEWRRARAFLRSRLSTEPPV
jgi:RNA polymerase sigma factor (TIGR02999 family)